MNEDYTMGTAQDDRDMSLAWLREANARFEARDAVLEWVTEIGHDALHAIAMVIFLLESDARAPKPSTDPLLKLLHKHLIKGGVTGDETGALLQLATAAQNLHEATQ